MQEHSSPHLSILVHSSAIVLLLLCVSQGAMAQQLTAYMIRNDLAGGDAESRLITIPVIPMPDSSFDNRVMPTVREAMNRRVRGIDAAPDGTLRAVDDQSDRLVGIDPVTGSASDLGPIGHDVGDQAVLCHDAKGDLWLIDEQDLLLLDLASGQATLVVVIDRPVEAAAWHHGALIGARSTELFRIDPSTGQTTSLTRGPGIVWREIDGLASDGRDLWGVVGTYLSSPATALYWQLVRIDPATGELTVDGWIRGSSADLFGLALVGSVTAIPATGLAGAALIALSLACAGVLCLRRRM